jgi:DNA ligase (NAD+)
MSERNIELEYLGKINLVKKYNKYYYDKNKPIISDREFDLLKSEIVSLENKYTFLNSKDSPTKSVGFKP